MRLGITFVSACLLPGLGLAQNPGRGNLGSNGVEPRLELGTGPLTPDLRVRATHLAPPGNSGATLYLLAATAPAAIPLSSSPSGPVLGLNPAVMAALGPIPVTASGTAEIVLRVPAAWVGMHVFWQAVYVDPRRAPYVALSDSRSATLGRSGPQVVLSASGTNGSTRLVRYFADGAQGTPLPFLSGIVLADLDVASLREARTFRDDLPRTVRRDGHRMVRLSDGSTLLRYERPAAGRAGLLHIDRSGSVRIVFEDKATRLSDEVIASPTHFAFATSSHRLYAYRSDGSNWPNTASPLRDVTPAGELDLESESIVFGSRVLACVDEHKGLFLVPLSGAAMIRPKLPASGGLAPTTFDKEIAVSGDGRSFAIGAGRDEDVKDIYVVRDDGAAVNVSRRPSRYAEVGYSNPGRRVALSLNRDGSLVSWVDITIKDDQNFLSSVPFPAPRRITTSETFKCIDIGSTARFTPKGGILIVAGQTNQTLDLFYSATGHSRDIIPLTMTSASNSPPYAADSKLTMFDLGSVRDPNYWLLWGRHLNGTDALYVIDPDAQDSRRSVAGYHGLGVGLRSTKRVLVGVGGDAVLVDPSDVSSGFARRIKLGAGTLVEMERMPGTDVVAAYSRSGASGELWRIDASRAQARRLTTRPIAIRALLATLAPGQLHVLVAGARGRELWRFTEARGLRRLGGSGLRAFLQH